MLLTAILMGLAGSLHCAGMCSPLAMAVTNATSRAFLNRVLYNLGRITMYGILGAVIASVGYIVPIAKYQNLISIVLGIILVVMATIGMTDVKLPLLSAGLAKLSGAIKSLFAKFLRHKSPMAMLLLGSLNGLLPCGLTFLALSFSITAASASGGFMLMFAFGLGTLPVMLGLVSIVPLLTNKIHLNIKSVTTGLMALSGILLIARVFLIHVPETHEHTNVIDIVICR